MRDRDREKRPPLIPPPLRIDAANAQAWRGELLLKLTPRAFAVLAYLVDHAGQLVTKEELMQTVWADTVVTDGALAASIRELRKALNDDAQSPQYIETVHRRGYRFCGPVVSSQQSVASSQEEENQKAKGKNQKAKIEFPSLAPDPWPPTPALVGRDTELSYLHSLFAKALAGARQMIFVTGEPGIGKTTLVDAFRQSLESRVQSPESQNTDPRPLTPDPWLGVGRCIEHYGAGEAYLPVLEALGRLCRGADGEHLIALLTHHAPTWLAQMPTLLSAPELEALQRKTQGATRERMLRELAEALEVITAERPLILVLEDLHWSDPSTLDLLSLLARRTEPARLLVIGTYRPIDVIVREHPLKTLKAELQLHGHCQELALELLTEVAVAEYLTARFAVGATGRSPLQRLAHTLHHRTEGNPLFLVAMVEDLITRGVFVQTATGWELKDEAAAIESRIPDSIRQLVTLQSDRLTPEAQYTLKAASIAGMEFSAASVAAALATDTAYIERQCEQLAEQGHFLQRLGIAEWPDGTLAARYGFLHAVYQQMWHERVSPTQLQQYHLRIGERKERAYGDRVREIAAELAVHFEQGREFSKAVQYLERSARNALRRSAYREALTLLKRSLELLKTLPDTIERVQQELRLQMLLATPLIALKGFTDPEIEVACYRARFLCERTGENPQIFAVLGGLVSLHMSRGELQTAIELAGQLLRLAEEAQDQRMLLWAHHTLGMVFGQTDYPSARIHLEQSLALYQPSHSLGFVQDPGATGLARLAWILLALGYPDQALKKSQEALSLARQLSHPFSLMHALDNASEIHRWRGEQRTAKELEEELMTLPPEHGFSYWSTEGMIRHGLALTRRGQIEEGLIHIQQAVRDLQVRGEELARPFALFRLADTHGQTGQTREGLRVLAEAFVIAQRNSQVMWEATLYLLKGELILQAENQKTEIPAPKSQLLNPKAQAKAESCFLKATDIARKQQAKSWELRAATSLARLWQQQGKVKQAHKMLSDIYNWFTEGFDTKDLQEAKALLESLEPDV